jgi:hypothetical protein
MGKNALKLSILIAIGIVSVIYFSLLIKNRLVNPPSKLPPAKSTDLEKIEASNKILDSLLVGNRYGFVVEYRDKERFLEIMVDGKLWKTVSLTDKKRFLKEIAKARATLGLFPEIRVIEYKSKVELASFEKGRVALGELDF